jgi:hypothetical protein
VHNAHTQAPPPKSVGVQPFVRSRHVPLQIVTCHSTVGGHQPRTSWLDVPVLIGHTQKAYEIHAKQVETGLVIVLFCGIYLGGMFGGSRSRAMTLTILGGGGGKGSQVSIIMTSIFRRIVRLLIHVRYRCISMNVRS